MEMNVCWCITPISVVLQVLQNSSEFMEMCVLALSVISKENYHLEKHAFLKERSNTCWTCKSLILFHEKSASCKRKCFTKGHEYKTWCIRQDSKFTEDPVLDDMLPHKNLCKRVSWYIQWFTWGKDLSLILSCTIVSGPSFLQRNIGSS